MHCIYIATIHFSIALKSRPTKVSDSISFFLLESAVSVLRRQKKLLKASTKVVIAHLHQDAGRQEGLHFGKIVKTIDSFYTIMKYKLVKVSNKAEK